MSRIRIAAAQWPVFAPTDWAMFETRLERWVADAAAQAAKLLVFPEYGAMSLTGLFSVAVQQNLSAQLEALQPLHAQWLALHTRLAQQHGMHILAGSYPVRDGTAYYNRAHLFAPNGDAGFQDKWTMTRFEREHWGISSGHALKVFDTALGMIGITICYDVEFPLLARAMVQAGAMLILSPSCTDAAAGYWRVRLGAQARALENQCVVVQSPLIGDAPWSAAVDINVGAAGIYSPPDRGLPDNGVLALGAWNQPQWLVAEVDLDALRSVRTDGQVLNHRDWAGQPGLGTPPAVVVERLR
jgi:predicted amidohydrolase